jgi:hypothetical protein
MVTRARRRGRVSDVPRAVHASSPRDVDGSYTSSNTGRHDPGRAP